MKSQPRSSRTKTQTIRLWTFDQAQAAIPYLQSVMHSLREHRLEWQAQDLRHKRLVDQPGRPNRQALIAQEEAGKLALAARDRFDAALLELQTIDVFCLDPIAGEAVIPFLHESELAWLIFDLFADPPLQSWRFQHDDLDVRRPLPEGMADQPLIV